MNKSKDKCMCSHKRSDHKQDIIHIPTVCNVCQCYDYMRNDRPSLVDKINLLYGIIVIAVFAMIFAYTSLFIFGLDGMDDDLSELLEMVDGYENNIFLIMLIFFILLCFIVFVSFINPYFYIKTRKKHSKI